ncbi:MAG: enoyl-CoA hydratase [Proteobacteria bacterium]|nr:enoyl-CoA hydratase [Pseudomonadota bacterium]
MDTVTTDKIIAKKEGAIGWLLYNNPDRHNAISLDMAAAGTAVIKQYAEDDEVRVIALRGVGGKAFVSGADISEFEKRRANADLAKEYAAVSSGMFRGVRGVEKPTVAVIEGICMGGGLGLSCACDLRICTDDSVFAIPAGRLGIGYGQDMTQWVIDAVGPANAKEILLTARRYTPEEAYHMGLVHKVAPRDGFDDFAAEYLGRIADNAPLSLKAAKLTINDIANGLGDADNAALDALVAACANSDDYKEGRTAFMEKRRPAFKGK